MKSAKTYTTIISILFIVAGTFAQVTVTGHACAEVVESVSATSGTNNLLSLQQDASPQDLDLGSFTLSGNSNAICSVVVNTTPLKGEHGDMVDFSASSCFGNNTGILNEKGTQVVNFKGNADNDILSSNDKNYEGQYDVVFAYN